MLKKVTGMCKKKLQDLLTFDTILGPKEAIELGLLDKEFGE